MGLLVSSLILSRIGLPQPGFFASTTTTPLLEMKTAVLPPPAVLGSLRSTKKLSFSFSTSMTFGALGLAAGAAGGCCAVAMKDNAQSARRVVKTRTRFMRSLQSRSLISRGLRGLHGLI